MRCLSCNKILTDYECSMKTTSGEYLDLCLSCYYPIRKEVPAVGNPFASHYGESDYDDFREEDDD